MIGGHQKGRDQENLARTAVRELWEEVPSIRGNVDYSLEALTEEVSYGPVVSRSVGAETLYLIQYFLLRISGNPTYLLENLGARTRNVLIAESELLRDRSGRISGLVWFLDKLLPGGISWNTAQLVLQYSIYGEKAAWVIGATRIPTFLSPCEGRPFNCRTSTPAASLTG